MDEALLELRSDGIVRVIFQENLVFDIEAQVKVTEQYDVLCEGKKYPFLFEAMENVTITKEARDNAKNLEDKAPVTVAAVLANSLPYRMMANFFLKFNKPKKPFKIFSNREDAIKWLLEQKEK